MKAITLTQPWATLVARGLKTVETRSWRTNYRGPLGIHAAKNFPRDARALLAYPEFACVRDDAFPRGAVVAVAYLIDCVQMPYAESYKDWLFEIGIQEPAREYEFGHYDSGRYAWVLRDVRPLNPPISAKGALGLWEWGEGRA